MTNLEWIKSLSAEQIAENKEMFDCNFCAYHKTTCSNAKCEDGVLKFLNAERAEVL